MLVNNKLCPSSDCTGCMACYNSCNKEAIIIHEDKEGFIHPVVNENLCVNCGNCTRVCPILNPKDNLNSFPIVYAAYSKSKDIVQSSSSGGIFSEIATIILNQSGVVYGAYFNCTNKIVQHIRIDNPIDLEKLRGSKYVQSRILNSYKNCKQDLLNGKYVLFSGTPCQIAGLYSFLDKDYNNLLTLDIVCHGVPSSKFFQNYLKKCGLDKKVFKFYFRNYKIWDYDTYIEVDKKRRFLFGEKDFFMKSFLNGEIFRKSCYNCKFSKIPRIGDISLGDFWGIKPTVGFNINHSGTSMVLINNKKGKEIFLQLNNIQSVEKTFEEAVAMNHNVYESSSRPQFRDSIYEDMFDESMSLNRLSKKYKHTPTMRNCLGFVKRRFHELLINK